MVFNNQKWQAVRGATLRMQPDGYASKANQMPLAHFTVEQNYEKMVEVSGGYGEQVSDPTKLMGVLEKAHKSVMVDKRQALVNVVSTDPI